MCPKTIKNRESKRHSITGSILGVSERVIIALVKRREPINKLRVQASVKDLATTMIVRWCERTQARTEADSQYQPNLTTIASNLVMQVQK